MSDSLKIIAISGSLRKASTHTALLHSLQALAPSGMTITIYDITDIPLFNDDLETPESVIKFQNSIEAADGTIWATPEYNGSMTGVIKNAIDWASIKKGLLAKTPTTVISGSPGALGATKGQESLRASLNHLGMYVLTRPSLAIPQLNKKLDGDTINDETTREFITSWLEAFKDWIIQLNK